MPKTAFFPSFLRRNRPRTSPRLVAWSVVATLAATLVPLAGSSSAADSAARAAYSPTTGVMFNNPLGTQAEKRRLVDHIIATVNATPAKSRIKMAVFSFADPAVADALINAYNRGVRVQLIFSDNTVYGPMRRLQRTLGGDRTKQSFAYWCVQSCRGTAGQMHAKYFSFRRAGSAEFVTMVGSVNLTRYNAEKQWNDLYTVSDDAEYFRAYTGWFRQLRQDQPQVQPFYSRTAGLNSVEMTPLDLTQMPDPVLNALSRVRCLVPRTEIDPTWPVPTDMVPTRIMISAHAWNGNRGRSIAWKLVELQRSGCQVQALLGVGTGGAVTSILGVAGIPINRGTHKGIHTHQKLMVVTGGFDGQVATARAWTGSHNWSDRALRRDDLIVTVNNPTLAMQYAALYDDMWARA